MDKELEKQVRQFLKDNLSLSISGSRERIEVDLKIFNQETNNYEHLSSDYLYLGSDY